MGQLIKSFPSAEYEIMIGHGSKAITKQHSQVVEQQHRIIDKDTLIRTNTPKKHTFSIKTDVMAQKSSDLYAICLLFIYFFFVSKHIGVSLEK